MVEEKRRKKTSLETLFRRVKVVIMACEEIRRDQYVMGNPANVTYVVATDVGGTCTDTIVFAPGKPLYLGKALSTPPNFAE